MLSPKAMNRVAPSTGMGGTYGANVTLKPQAAVRAGVLESVAVHATVVAPTGNAAPDAGAQVAVTGPSPPAEIGGDHWTGWVGVVTSGMLTSPGHVSASGATGSTGGPVGLLGE
jgi:hypothetical protein